ncbi:hypothetical protein MRX96_024924 [Rhipicephalus microplus]
MRDRSSAVANYLGWHIVQVMGQYATERFRRARFRLDRYRYLLQDVGEIPRECLRLTSRLLHFAVGRLYFVRHISRPAERFPDLRKEDFFISLLRTLKIYNRIMYAHLRRFKKAEDFGRVWSEPV